jgi:DtxR family Mn-dependent transcriptional regulator
MLASQTVENYLKAIYLAQGTVAAGGEGASETDRGLVPMGQLAAALGVVPGTATTMVKTLAESGLVHYEPYMGVRLTPAGERLAALVLRRHRLIEQFLVQVLGMNWSEVHDEAERLEHAVSERLIDRIDEMLGRPAVDPHGDPIPGPEGTLASQTYPDLLTCPVDTPLLVTRVTDQDAKFLRFIEDRHLKPGQRISIVIRDPASDSVTIRSDNGHETTIGTRAASKVLVVPA